MRSDAALRLRPGGMVPARLQWDSADAQPDAARGALLLLNMREHTADELRRVASPALCALLPRRPDVADRRDDEVMLLSAAGGVGLRLEGAVRADGSFESIDEEICELPAPLGEAAPAGEFLVLRLSDGTLFFLLWHADLRRYSALGRLPQLPRIDVEAADVVSLTATVDAVTFRRTLSDPRSGFTDTDTQAMGKAAGEAWARLRGYAAAQGRRVGPVAVRVAARLWDGRLLAVSAPAIVSCGWQEEGRVQLPLAGSAGAYAGTLEGSVGARAYKIGVDASDVDTGGWSDVIRSYEVWATDEVPLREGAPASAAYNPAMPGVALITLAGPDREMALTALLGAGMRRVGSVEAGGRCVVGRADHAPLRHLPAEVEALAGMRARTLLGHAGFLHLGGVGRRSPEPQFPRGEGSGRVVWRVAVRLASLDGDRWICSTGSATGAASQTAPLLWYASRDAREMVVSICDSAGTWREGAFTLHPAEWDEESSYLLDADLRGFELEEVEAPRRIVESPVWTEGRRELVSSVRGNPLLVASRTADVGGDIRVLAAQPVGGGAYTRQFLYCFTPEGISALTHAPDGTHTNCRRISALRVDSPGRVADGEDGVWVLDSEGALALLRDARVDVRLRGLRAYTSIVRAAPFNELHLVPSRAGARGMVLDCTTGRVGMRTAVPRECICPGGRPLYLEALGQAWCVNMLEPPGASAIGTDCEWISSEFHAPVGGAAELSVDWPSAPEDAVVEMQICPAGHSPLTVASVRVRTGCGRPTRLGLLLPSADAEAYCNPPRWRVRIHGRFAALGAVELRGCSSRDRTEQSAARRR